MSKRNVSVIHSEEDIHALLTSSLSRLSSSSTKNRNMTDKNVNIFSLMSLIPVQMIKRWSIMGDLVIKTELADLEKKYPGCNPKGINLYKVFLHRPDASVFSLNPFQVLNPYAKSRNKTENVLNIADKFSKGDNNELASSYINLLFDKCVEGADIKTGHDSFPLVIIGHPNIGISPVSPVILFKSDSSNRNKVLISDTPVTIVQMLNQAKHMKATNFSVGSSAPGLMRRNTYGAFPGIDGYIVDFPPLVLDDYDEETETSGSPLAVLFSSLRKVMKNMDYQNDDFRLVHYAVRMAISEQLLISTIIGVSLSQAYIGTSNSEVEYDHLAKCCNQRHPVYGHMMSLIYAPKIAQGDGDPILPEDYMAFITEVASDLYKKGIERAQSMKAYSFDGLSDLITNPPGTSTGAPFYYTASSKIKLSGTGDLDAVIDGNTFDWAAQRLLSAKICPSPFKTTKPSWDIKDAKVWFKELDSLSSKLGLPHHKMMYATQYLTRSGMKRREFHPVRYGKGLSYASQIYASGFNSYVRPVFGAPYYINAVFSPLAAITKLGRQAIRGLWHDPESQAKYLPMLSKYKTVLAVDQKTFDASISLKELIASIKGYSKADNNLTALADLKIKWLEELSVLYPNMHSPNPEEETLLELKTRLVSGELDTSGQGTIISLSRFCWTSAKATGLSPSAIWNDIKNEINNYLIILDQSDDIELCHNFPSFDDNKFSEAWSQMSTSASTSQGTVFLMKYLPVGDSKKAVATHKMITSHPSGTGNVISLPPSISRSIFIQSFMNEHTIVRGKYTGAFRRLSFRARTANLDMFPPFNESVKTPVTNSIIKDNLQKALKSQEIASSSLVSPLLEYMLAPSVSIVKESIGSYAQLISDLISQYDPWLRKQASIQTNLFSPNYTLSAEDEELIAKFGASSEGLEYLEKLSEQAEYNPSAYILLTSIMDLVDIPTDQRNLAIKKQINSLLASEPSTSDIMIARKYVSERWS